MQFMRILHMPHILCTMSCMWRDGHTWSNYISHCGALSLYSLLIVVIELYMVIIILVECKALSDKCQKYYTQQAGYISVVTFEL